MTLSDYIKQIQLSRNESSKQVTFKTTVHKIRKVVSDMQMLSYKGGNAA
jgi:two-component SAPR family response regulator